MSSALGIINFASNLTKVAGLQDYRSVGAISFLGRYRVIDFPISNFSNSGMENIHVYTRWKPRSLAEHLGTGRQYNINSKRGRMNWTVCIAMISLLTWTISKSSRIPAMIM